MSSVIKTINSFKKPLRNSKKEAESFFLSALVLCMWRPLQVLGSHRHAAPASGLREAGPSAAADQLLEQHAANHVPLPEVSGLSL